MTSSLPHSSRSNLLLPELPLWTKEQGPIIRLNNVSVSFPEKQILENVSFSIEPEKITVIFGASGAGKSLLMKLMAGLIRPDSGSIEVFGVDLQSASYSEIDQIRKRTGTLFQNYALFDSMTVLQNVAFPLVQHATISESEAYRLSAARLTDLGLGDVLHHMPSELSGGMKKRVSVARALIANPELFLLDDPTTGLDPILMRYVDDMILEITNDFNLTTVIVSHNLPSIFRTADTLLVLDQGSIIASGTPQEILNLPEPRLQQHVGRLQRSDISLVQASPSELETEPSVVVKFEQVTKSFGNRCILKGVNLQIPKDHITVLIGGSGAGKSVLMKHIIGLLMPDTGTLSLFGKDLSTLSLQELQQLRTRIGMLFQHAALFESITVLENVLFPLWERRTTSYDEAKQRASELLDHLKVGDIASSLPSEISNGQQKRVSLARALISNPGLIVYDEPTTGQDPVMSDYIEELILDVQKDFDVTSIVISHDMASSLRIANQLAILVEGEILHCGPPSSFINPTDPRIREFVYASQIDFDALVSPQ